MNTPWQEPLTIMTDANGFASVPLTLGPNQSLMIHAGSRLAYLWTVQPDAVVVKITDDSGRPTASAQAELRLALVG